MLVFEPTACTAAPPEILQWVVNWWYMLDFDQEVGMSLGFNCLLMAKAIGGICLCLQIWKKAWNEILTFYPSMAGHTLEKVKLLLQK